VNPHETSYALNSVSLHKLLYRCGVHLPNEMIIIKNLTHISSGPIAMLGNSLSVLTASFQSATQNSDDPKTLMLLYCHHLTDLLPSHLTVSSRLEVMHSSLVGLYAPNGVGGIGLPSGRTLFISHKVFSYQDKWFTVGFLCKLSSVSMENFSGEMFN